jgi:tetratricopeptide (TPR) repeat protein
MSLPDTAARSEPSPDAVTRPAAPPAGDGITPTVVAGEVGTGSAERPPVGGRYALGAELARGGMGVVYRADDTALGRPVAIKVLAPGHSPGLARRFHDEARITGQLQHPNIPPVHDLGTLPDGRPFLAMKLIKGDTLAQLLKDQPDPAADGTHSTGALVAVFEQICQAVACAHAHNVIHRDLKPQNVMVGKFGEVQVMDWGLAKVLTDRGIGRADANPEATTAASAVKSLRDTDDQLTQAGSVLGTPAYMPPEQAIGAVDQIDRRSDVFGLGGILAAILTGRPPFTAETTEGIRQMAARGKVDDCFARLDACGADPGLVGLCKRCLSPEKGDRPADADEVARAVAALRAAADERARQAELGRVRSDGERAAAEVRAAEYRRRARLRLALATAVAALVAVGGGSAWYLDRQAAAQEQERARQAAEKEREQAEQERQKERARAEQERQAAEARATARRNLDAALSQAAVSLREERLPAAAAALDRAADLLGPAAAADLKARHDDLRADLALAAELDRVWSRASAVLPDNVPGQARRTAEGLRFDDEAARTGYPAALAARGLAVVTGDPAVVADRVGRSPIRERVVAALDDWLPVARPEDRPRLCDLLARTDPHPARTAIRRAHLEPATVPDALADPPPDALRVAARAAMAGGGADRDAGAEFGPLLDSRGQLRAAGQAADPRVWAVLQTAAARHPDDFRVQYAAGVAGVRTAARFETAVGHLRAAVALRPDNMAAVFTLGSALYPAGRLDEGAGYLLRAVELDPGFVAAYIGLADAIKNNADRAPAVAHFERAVGRAPDSAMAHFGLGMALRDQEPGRAVKAFERSIELDPAFAPAHNYLGYALGHTPALDRRIGCYRKAIELDPTFAFPHYNLANALQQKRDWAAAEAEYRTALRLFPGHAFSRDALADLLARQGKWAEAAKHWQAAIFASPAFTPAYVPLGRYLLQTREYAGAAAVFAEYVRRAPADFNGYAGLVRALARQGRHAAVVSGYTSLAFQGFPAAWPAEKVQLLRYDVACSAALAAAGEATDAPAGADRVLFRTQALLWLRANLAELRKQGRSPAADGRKRAADVLTWWWSDPDLSHTRPGADRPFLSAAERAEWDAFWDDVRAAVNEARPAPPHLAPPPRAGG